ncbi:uncharacterized protein ASPGLDRAFT_1410175 [Aspergillus glaucus CBS 516.65]|uniref:Uncharacterized protein n=1 Tax=Aspergillus glaucus CBS 516.65 TaxID=1160497 RepID=A0A1L9VM91_ASPGL|nr:hypothetical protein ASPGLDRAFT_1410175 [Aspergillus glaucus CBS 516.65]OJJ85011.1 hypothetical protein ASPGLDRAFT_1410175 [Aspergillus glaucus CBS 516.65]
MAIQLSSIGNQESTPAVISNQNTTKIPDPPMLTDGKEPRFEDWLLLMTQKLAANADYFDTSQLRVAYVASHCEGKARKHITLRMRDDSRNPYADSNDMLDHLKTIYSDPNRVTTAKHQFQQLYMKKLCISSSIKEGTFQEFSSNVSQTASRLEVINHRTQNNHSFTPNNRDSSKGGTNRSKTTAKKELTPSRSTSPTSSRTASTSRDRLMK